MLKREPLTLLSSGRFSEDLKETEGRCLMGSILAGHGLDDTESFSQRDFSYTELNSCFTKTCEQGKDQDLFP